MLFDLEINFENSTNSSELDYISPSLFNFSISDVYKVISEKSKGSYLGLTAQVVLITIYILLIVLGIIGNVLVAFVIGNKSELRTIRNLYIINLTVSDISMCLVCMPFTLVGLLKKSWTLGNIICKLIPALQCTNILVSTATIVAIAADRYTTIVRNNRNFRPHTSVPCSVILIWVVSLAFTCPLFIYYYVERVSIRQIFLYNICMDNWQPPLIKAIWTICLLLMQYVIPISVLSFVHIKIKKYLSENQASQRDPRRMQREIERNRRTTTLLTSVALTFAVSWLPWHVVNFLADFHYSGFRETEYFYLVFGGCHAIAMSTACSNPILYGWLNTNLKKEISGILSKCLRKIYCKSCSRAYRNYQRRMEAKSVMRSSVRSKICQKDSFIPENSDVATVSCNQTRSEDVEQPLSKDLSPRSPQDDANHKNLKSKDEFRSNCEPKESIQMVVMENHDDTTKQINISTLKVNEIDPIMAQKRSYLRLPLMKKL